MEIFFDSGLMVLFLIAALVFIIVDKSVAIVPQQHAWVIERLGKYDRSLSAGLGFCVPFIERVAYKHSLKEDVLDVDPQICITADNSQLKIDGVLYYQVTDPRLASYGSSNYLDAIRQLAQTTLRSEIGRLELDKAFQERDAINTKVVSVIDEAATNWGVKVLRYEIKDLTPPEGILKAMEAQIRAEREKRALIAASEGRRQEQINIAEGEREAAIRQSEGEKQAAINKAEGEAMAITLVAEATAQAIVKVAGASEAPGGMNAINLQLGEKYVAAFAELAKEGNTVILPADLSSVGSLVAGAMGILKGVQQGGAGQGDALRR